MAPASSKEAVLNLGAMAATVVALNSLFTRMAGGDSYLYDFFWLFAWRYLRFFVNFIAFWCYSPSPKPKGEPTYLPSRDVTVVIPTVDPMGAAFLDCLTSCAANQPAKIVIITAGEDLYAKTLAQVRRVRDQFKATQFGVDRTQAASKRAQVAHAVPHVETDITVLLDDHVFWKPQFLASVLCPFEKPNVGLVGTNKVVRRLEGLTVWRRIWNMIGATYLCRHNFEIRATNTVDGGVFVISGRTCAIRTCILKHPEFLRGYNNEMFFFGLLGPIKPDDDNYITRFVVRHGWDIKIQYTDDSLMETVIGVEDPLVKKYLGQCKRWARTTWRSNPCSLFTDRTVWSRQPYCVYAVYLTSLTNFAAIIDPLLIYLFTHSSAYVSAKSLACLVGWILLTKVPKIFAYFRQHPQDIWLFPVYVLFAYFHSFIKLWALLTFYDCGWSGRQLNDMKVNP
ncbi:glycosyltransferase family 2 protein [Canariomyces notabilis]|uniref:Glycosyltransferase family 2 protein n=1 Tax=Canariomyces notabilis TaxID=2074819 RepID=A0AAN6TMK2_9PEZI|nr:glycosyltransferase family 2 protein [Canariomyces arenarius]